MVSKAKLYSKLDGLEAELLERLVPHLANAADGKNDLIFCAKGFSSYREFKDCTDSLTEELVEIGSQILMLREKLGEPCDGIIAARICWYCREWGNAKKYRRSSGMVLAKRFLNEIETNQTA